MVTIPNIYKSKHAKYFILIPLVLFVVGIYFATHITLDSSLSGGVSRPIQTNTTINQQQLASQISSSLHVSSPSIQGSPSGVQITLSLNQSIANAESSLLDVYGYGKNYSNANFNITTLSVALSNSPNNQTLITQLDAARKLSNSSLANARSSLQSELAYLEPFVGTTYLNSTITPSEMATVGQSRYTNASAVYQNQIITALHKVIPFTTYSYQQVTATLGSYFLGQLTDVVVIAFILISIVVFFIFRSVVPAFAVIFGAANDMIVALGAMGLFGIPLGIASIGALLMLIGYAIDTDVLTAVRILKRHEGTPEDRAYSSMKTGLTMTATALVSFSVLFIVSLFAYVPTYYEISAVMICGLIADVFTTWFMSARLSLWYKNRKEGKK